MASPLTGVPSTNQDLVLRALNELLQVAVQLACECIDQVQRTAWKTARRNQNVSFLDRGPLLCTRLRDTARGDPRYAAIMYYERSRLGASASSHFLEALPTGLTLFVGPTAVQLNNSDLLKLKPGDVKNDRRRTLENLETLGNDSPNLQRLVRDYLVTDAPSGLPGRVHVFLARQRAICQGLLRVRPPAQFKQCRNCECQRLFYWGPDAWQLADEDPLGQSDNGDYWELAAGSPSPGGVRRYQFCTWSCWVQWRNQLQAALPSDAAYVMVADAVCRKTDRARVSEALRACGKRNEAASRHLRAIEKQQRTFGALSKAELKRQRARRVRMLNVDLGLLYATSVVAESRGMSMNRVLAGASPGWRSRPAFYAKGLKEVGKIHDKYHKGDTIVSNMLVHDRFLAKLKQKASTLF
jgi:hypothetical protein